MQAAVSLAEHDALNLLLQHSSISQDVKLLCSLLCVCKPMRISIAQQCRNQLALECTVTQSLPQVTMFASFLRHWAGLAKTLELNWDRISLPDVEGLLSEALQAAAVTDAAADAVLAGRNGVDICTGPLQVTSVKANVAGPLLLGQLPASTLTCLELGHVVDYACECAEPAHSSSSKAHRCMASKGAGHTLWCACAQVCIRQ